MQTKKEAPENITMKNWPELAVRKVWPFAIRLPGVRERLPAEWTGGLRTDKNFFWSTLIGQHEEWVKALVNNCTA